jgi:hypothetical protein
MRVVVGLSWPSHKAMTVMSTPAWRSFIAAVCLRVCGVIFLAVKDGAGRRRHVGVFSGQVADGAAGHWGAAAGAEQWSGPGGAAFGEPLGEDPGCVDG